MINKPPELKPTILSQKIAYLSMFVMSLVLFSYYKGFLKASLSVRSLDLPINNVHDILKSSLDFIVWKNAAEEDVFRLAAPGSLKRRVYESKIQNSPGVIDIGGTDPSMDLVLKGDAMLFAASENEIARPVYPCQVTDVKSLRERMTLALPFKKNGPFYHSFQKALDKLRERGIVQKIDTQFKLNLMIKEHVQCDPGIVSIHSFQRIQQSYHHQQLINKAGEPWISSDILSICLSPCWIWICNHYHGTGETKEVSSKSQR